MIKNFDMLLLNESMSLGPKRVAVAAADDKETITAVIEARNIGVAEPILIGNKEWIDLIFERLDEDARKFEVIHEKDPVNAAAIAADVIRSGRGDILMKGNVVTSKFLQAALGPSGRLKDRLLSDVEVYMRTRMEGTSASFSSAMEVSIFHRASDKKLRLSKTPLRWLTGWEYRVRKLHYFPGLNVFIPISNRQ